MLEYPFADIVAPSIGAPVVFVTVPEIVPVF